MINWFIRLNIGSKIALSFLIATSFFGTVALAKSNTVDKNLALIVDDELSEKNIEELAQKIAKKLRKNNNPQAKAFIKTDDKFILEEMTKLLTSKSADLQEVINKLRQNKIDYVTKLLSEIDKERKKKNVETKLYLAALLTYKNPQKSFDLLKQAISLNKTNLQYLNQYALLAMRLGHTQVAIDTFLSILKINKDKKVERVALGNLGSSYTYLNKVEKAIYYYEKALLISREIKDKQGEISDLNNLGSAYLKVGKVGKAITYYEQQALLIKEMKKNKAK